MYQIKLCSAAPTPIRVPSPSPSSHAPMLPSRRPPPSHTPVEPKTSIPTPFGTPPPIGVNRNAPGSASPRAHRMVGYVPHNVVLKSLSQTCFITTLLLQHYNVDYYCVVDSMLCKVKMVTGCHFIACLHAYPVHNVIKLFTALASSHQGKGLVPTNVRPVQVTVYVE